MADNPRTLLQPRADARGVSAVVGTLLMVAITISLAAVLYFTVGGMLGSTPVREPKFILSPGDWTTNGSIVVNILSVTDADGVKPSNLKFLVQSTNGTVYYFGGQGNLTLAANITVTVTYNDAGTEFVGPDDHITLTVFPANATAVRTATFKVLVGEAVAGQVEHLS